MSQAVRKRSFRGEIVMTEVSKQISSLVDEPIQISGKWTEEEETIANQLVIDFEIGQLIDCEEGCTLRSYLARKLNCAPMRISKKFAGRCVGKLPFVRRNSHMTSLERKAIELSTIPVLRRPRNINHRPKKNRLHRSVTSDSDDACRDLSSDRSSPIWDGELNEILSNSSSDETDIGSCDENPIKIEISKNETNCSSIISSSGLNSICLPSLFVDDFESFESDIPYDPVFSNSYEDNNHVVGDDWHEVLSFFRNNEERESLI